MYETFSNLDVNNLELKDKRQYFIPLEYDLMDKTGHRGSAYL